MIVRPTVSSSFTARRSQSTPPRRRSNSAGAASAESTPALPAAAHLLVQALHTSSTPVPELPLRSSSSKRKLFRLKRPSSSHAEKSGLREDQPPHTSPSAPASPAVPPRPARNPARLNSYQGLSTSDAPGSSFVHDVESATHSQTDTRQLRNADDGADWEFRLPRGSEFPLQRKKSKSSKGSAKRAMQGDSAKNDLLFSTLDRAILEELRQKIQAREDHYDRQVTDLDVWDNLWQQQLGGSITMHAFKTAPTRVLELGCGTGTWILNAAREWKDSHFVGVDIVPLHPDLIQVGSFDLASRITWVQANFLERLPFQNEEFDYVLSPIQMWEEDLRFPGSRRETDSILDSPAPKHDSPPTPPHTDSSHSSEQEKFLPSTPYELPVHRSLACSYSFDDVVRVKNGSLENKTIRPLRAVPSNLNIASTPTLLRTVERPPPNPHDHSLLETIYDEMHAARFINLDPLSLLANLLPLHLRDVRAPPPVIIYFPQSPAATPTSTSNPSMPFAIHHKVPLMGEPHSDDQEHVTMASGRQSLSMLNGREVAKGTPFVTLDTSRYNGISPAALRRSTLPPTPRPTRSDHTLEVRASSATTDKALGQSPLHGMNPLPNKTVNFDPRGLNLILALRVQEVVACAEPMWDWVVDFQETILRSARRQGAAQPSDHLAFSTSRRRRHPKQDALMALTREQFDELLWRFELDMKSRMHLGTVVKERMGWDPCSPSTSEEQETFKAMCASWAEYERRVAGSNRRNRDFSSPPPPLSRQSNLRRETQSARNEPHPRSPLALGSEGSTERSELAQTANSTASSNSWSGYAAPPSLSGDSPAPSSRIGRIFVAWKA
ncbi:hypothetical protein BN946_scf184842.g11 [Trametes cinnabarina]|uniref:Methyltransferase domain-containing protein n=1 Tax=Pycnoporus cinnabarinus TaxID=5643 RepID=A0A060S786_PYCCI|nr:hypothetical protein BN946_scf184842.g11 [Trametes cinnabarina]